MSDPILAPNQEAFLAHIRARLANSRQSPHPGGFPARAQAAGDVPRAGAARRALIDRFVAELTAVGGHAERIGQPGDLAVYLRRLAESADRKLAVREDDPRWREPQGAPWLAALAGSGLEVVTASAARATLAAADIGITWADWGIAETGTLVQLTGPGRARTVSLLPPVHVALLPAERILAQRSELMRILRESGPSGLLPSQVVLITGPSRTGDIENDLTIGVHGPGEVHVLIIESEADTAETATGPCGDGEAAPW